MPTTEVRYAGTDLARLYAEFADLLRGAGVPVPVERVGWWAQVSLATDPTGVGELYWLARVTLVDRAEHLATFDAVFAQVFRGRAIATRSPVDPATSPAPSPKAEPVPAPDDNPSPGTSSAAPDSSDSAGDSDDPATAPTLASELELLRDKDFADCDAQELAELGTLIDKMRVVAPVRSARWQPSGHSGRAVDLRRTLRASRRTGGDPVRFRYRRRGTTPRRIVLLADVSGSMLAYSRVYLRVLQGAVLGARANAYVFATQLHPVTRALGRGRREAAIGRALALAPDAAGGTRIGAAIKTFLDTDGRRGLARGAVIVIVSDGWERADPTLLAEQLTRLARLARTVIWVNPRKAAPGFVPLAGGMAAALPHVDTFVSGHSARAVQELLDAIAAG